MSSTTQPSERTTPTLEALALTSWRLLELGLNLTSADGRRDDRFSFLGYGVHQITQRLIAYEPRVRRSHETLRPTMSFTTAARTYAVNRHTERRRVTMWCATPSVHLSPNSLVQLQDQHLVAAPVHCQLAVLDGTLAVVAGQNHASGDPTAWATTHPDIVATARRLVAQTRAVAQAPTVPADSPGSRQLAVARLVLLGSKNSTIARHLSVSERTVGSDIAKLAAYTGVRGRAELVDHLGGRLDPRLTLEEMTVAP